MGHYVYKGSVEFSIMWCMRAGVRRSLLTTARLPPRALRRDDFRDSKLTVQCSGNALHTLGYTIGGGGAAVAHLPVSGSSFRFTTYSPMCFRHIRELAGVDLAHFVRTLAGVGNWQHRITPGKSAALFYFVGTSYVVKTLTRGESKLLQRILRHYYRHLWRNPHTLLPLFYGHYALRLRARKIRFVVMNNVFDAPLNVVEKFDLKGSRAGRELGDEAAADAIKKDVDLEAESRRFALGPGGPVMLKQLARDCAFLRRAGIMDYSLLVGIARLPSDPAAVAAAATLSAETAAQRAVRYSAHPPKSSLRLQSDADLAEEQWEKAGAADGAMLTAQFGGVRGVGVASEEVYYFGIVDILQEYNLRKKGERLLSVLSCSGVETAEISCMPPAPYASRLMSFVRSAVV